MISLDTNVLLYALNQDCPEYAAARGFLNECAARDDVAICELVLVELYQLLRCEALIRRPYNARDAAETCQSLRRNPRWALIENAPVMDKVWLFAARPGIARRRLFDARIAYTMLHHGVTGFATRNVKDFADFGFASVWDPTRE